jgi:hypothetical protein
MQTIKIIIATLNMLVFTALFFFARKQEDKGVKILFGFIEFLWVANAVLLFV